MRITGRLIIFGNIYFIFNIYKMSRKLFGNDYELNNLLAKSIVFDIIDVVDDYEINTNGSLLNINKGVNNLFQLSKDFCISNKKLGVNNSNPLYSLDVDGDINFTTLKINGVDKPSSTFSLNGNDIYYNDGNVGIGISNPSSFLQVSSLNNPTLFIDGSNTSRIDLGLQNGSSLSKISSVSFGTTSSNLIFNVGTSTNTTEEVLKINQDTSIDLSGDFKGQSSFGVDFLTINNTGMGINNTPSLLCDVGDGSNVAKFLTLETYFNLWHFEADGSGSSTNLNFRNDNGGLSHKDFNIANNSSGNKAITFRVSNTSSNQRILINESGGRTGIRNTNPSTELEVNGNIDITGNIISNTTGQLLNACYGYIREGTGFTFSQYSFNGTADIVRVSYQPVSDDSWIEICFDGNHYHDGSGADSFGLKIRYEYNDGIFFYTDELAYHYMISRTTNGSGGRGGFGYPITAVYDNSNTLLKSFVLFLDFQSINDTIYLLWDNDFTHHFYILEYKK